METPRDDRLAEDLRALRPTPRPEFAAELDERAAAGFPRRSRWSLPFSFSPRRMLIPAGGVAVLAIAAVTAVIAIGNRDAGSPAGGGSSVEFSADTATKDVPSAASAGAAAEVQAQPLSGEIEPRLANRAVERSAELVLAADPADLADDSAAVFDAVHANNGIVMRSSTREGEPGVAAARFELLIPSGRLGDALAALSAIDEVRSRHEATNDITAPSVTVAELLQDSKARIDSLLGQLQEAETESEREAVEAELRQERRHRARLRAQLQQLERRADFSRVLVRIETGGSEDSSGGAAWGIDDALGDAGKILAVAAAVTVVALAVLGPIALIALLAWLTHRAWVRRERRRVLS